MVVRLKSKFWLWLVGRWRWPMCTFLIVLSISSSDCALTRFAPRVDQADESSVDRNAARTLSDSVANDLLQDDRDAIQSKFEKVLRASTTDKEFNSMLSQVFELYGKPLEFEFKQDESGSKKYSDGETRPMRKFWYAAKTTRYEKGSYFLIVEVVPDDGTLAVSSFSMVNFPLGVPETLK